MRTYPKILSAAAVAFCAGTAAQSGDALGGLGLSADVDAGSIASADLDVSLGDSGGSDHSGGLSVGLDVGVPAHGHGGTGSGGIGVQVGVGGGTGAGGTTPPAVTPPVQGTGIGAGEVQQPALQRLLGMAVLSSDRKLVGMLDGIERHPQGYRMRIRVAEGLGARVPYITVESGALSVSDVIRLQLTLRHLLTQI